jgi:histidinol-phosphate aminotransferase
MSAILNLVRPEIRELRPYVAAQFEAGMLRLNANETPWPPPGDHSAEGLNHYPEIRPVRLTRHLADHYGLQPEQLLVTRGSSEAIDLLVRCFCRATQDDIVICPPTFGMYEVYAQLQSAGTIHVPLLKAEGYALDVEAIKRAWSARCKLLFICSPNNPTGNRVPTAQIDELCEFLGGRGLVVVDAAYVEFANEDPTAGLLQRHENVAILRTLSKALGLAGIRCGAVAASPAVIGILGCILPPYSYPTPSQDAALACLDPAFRGELNKRTATLRTERERLATQIGQLPNVTKVWPSEANFLLVETSAPAQLVTAAKSGGVLIRDFSWDPFTKNCLRVTVGNTAQNDQLLAALNKQE